MQKVISNSALVIAVGYNFEDERFPRNYVDLLDLILNFYS